MNIHTNKDQVKAQVARLKRDWTKYNGELDVYDVLNICQRVSRDACDEDGTTTPTELHAALVLAIETIVEMQDNQKQLGQDIRQLLSQSRDFKLKVED